METIENKYNKLPFYLRILGMGTPYFVRTPTWLKKLYPHRKWNNPRDQKTIYLTFDDGPHETVTPFVLDCLDRYNAKATFFSIGKNVEANPLLFRRIQDAGHAVGNHTHDHVNGFKTSRDEYLSNISKASSFIPSRLFRPPYGRLRSSQARLLQEYEIIMWDVLSGDFDQHLSKERCLQNILKNSRPGSIIVFHDSEKAAEKLYWCLPKVLEHFKLQGYQFSKLESY